MLLSSEIEDLARDFQREAVTRPYMSTLMPGVVADITFWRMLLEVVEIILHKRGYVIAKTSDVIRPPEVKANTPVRSS